MQNFNVLTDNEIADLCGLERPTSGFFILTPDMADTILKMRFRTNRPIRPSKLGQLVTDIENGNFLLNGESIIFDVGGQLIDGQHRVHAVKESGKSIISLIAFGIDPNAMATVDQGAARRPGDALAIDGETNAMNLAATARIVYAYEGSGGENLSTMNRASRADILDTIDIYPKLRDSVKFATGYGSTPFKGLASASIFAAAHFILSNKYGNERIEKMLDRVILGHELSPRSPALAMRNRLLGNGRNGAGPALEIILRGWLAELRGRDIATIPVTGTMPTLISERHRIGSMKAAPEARMAGMKAMHAKRKEKV